MVCDSSWPYNNVVFSIVHLSSDYITEKLWGALESGTLPVYYGAPNVKEHVPPNSIIVVQDFADTASLANYLKQVATNKTMYDFYHTWRTKPLPKSFLDKYRMTDTHSSCRMCRWVHAKKHGLGWNHIRQEIVDLKIPRQSCVSPDNLMVRPLVESFGLWPGADRSDESVCFEHEKGVLSVGGMNRSMWYHDGFIDLTLGSRVAVGLTWSFSIPWSGPWDFTAKEDGYSWIQSSESRVSFVTFPKANVTYHDGTVIVPVIPDLTLRVVVEDLDLLHPESLGEESYFARTGRVDLWTPMEAFYVL